MNETNIAVLPWAHVWTEEARNRRSSDGGHMTPRESRQYAVPCHGCPMRERCAAERLACVAFVRFLWDAPWTAEQRAEPSPEIFARSERNCEPGEVEAYA